VRALATERLRLGVVFGGRSVEHEVSVVSAQDVLAATDSDRFELVPIGVTKEGVWLSPEETQAQLARPEPLFRKTLTAEARPNLSTGVAALAGLDVVFPLIHGTHGEDGCLQGVLEMMGLPYVGCGVAASAIGMDKGLMKAVFRDAGISVAQHVLLRLPPDESSLIARARDLEDELGFPIFVKPANGGSSVGVSKASSREELVGAIAAAGRIDRRIVVEEMISGREVECAVMGNEHLEASPVGEIRHRREFYDYEAKYLDPATEILAPADVPADVVARLQEQALRAFRAIDGAGLGRVDFFLRDDDSLVIDEINTLPGFRPSSMFPRLWQAAGVSYSTLITRLVELALARKERPIA
jgi:D-alanine-D-alanine ligase